MTSTLSMPIPAAVGTLDARYQPLEKAKPLTIGRVIAIVAGHCVLAEIINRAPILSALYAWTVLIYALAMASTKSAKSAWSALAYLVAAEVLWRMTRAWASPLPVFWEFGKYGSILCLLAILSRGRGHVPWAPLVYLAALLPSVPFTLAVGLQDARQFIGFNLSGPFALALAAVAAFRTAPRDRPGINECASLVWPLAGVAWLCARAVFGGTVVFGTESVVAAAAGYGPNQVSAMLGLGALMALGIASSPALPSGVGLALTGVAAWFALQGLLTFSRGGMLAGGLPLVIIAAQNFVRRGASHKARAMTWGTFTFVGLLVAAWVANSVTGGLLADRYGELDTTGRGDLALSDIEIARSNPLLGVGPGMSGRLHRDNVGRYATAHTEFTRVISEHGAIGALGMITLMLWTASVLWNHRKSPSIFLGAALTAWVFLSMAHMAMRLAAVGVVLGLAVSLIERETPPIERIPVGRPGSLRPKLPSRSQAPAHQRPHPSRARRAFGGVRRPAGRARHPAPSR